MVSKYIKALMLPDGSTLQIGLIAQVVRYEEGVGLLNDRARMVGWIDIQAEDPEVREERFRNTLTIMNEVVNNPRRAVQPDWF
jgi:hypothetical protein